MRSLRNLLKEEFSMQNIWFTCPTHEAFYLPQWKWPHLVFIFYRLVLALFTLACLLDYMIIMTENPAVPHNPMVYLTTWSYILLVLHFNMAAVITLHCFCKALQVTDDQDGIAVLKISSSSPLHGAIEIGHVADAMNNCVMPSDTVIATDRNNRNYCSNDEEDYVKDTTAMEAQCNQYSVDNDDNDGIREAPYGCTLPGTHNNNPAWNMDLTAKTKFTITFGKSRWYMKLSWLIFELVSVSAVIVSLVYFIGVFPTVHTKRVPILFEDLSVHGINTVLVLVDIGVSAYPVRLLHGLYPMLYGLLYILFNLSYWLHDRKRNVVYQGLLDWNYPGKALLLVLILAFVVTPVLQLIHFLLYRFRLFIYLKIYKDRFMT